MHARLVFAHNPGPMTGAGSNTWLIDGPDATLIDAGSGDPRHVTELASALDETGSTLAQVLVTHAHPDHAGGAPALAERWPAATFAKYPWPERDIVLPRGWLPVRDDELITVG